MHKAMWSLEVYDDGQYGQKPRLWRQIQNPTKSHDKELSGKQTTISQRNAIYLCHDQRTRQESGASGKRSPAQYHSPQMCRLASSKAYRP